MLSPDSQRFTTKVINITHPTTLSELAYSEASNGVDDRFNPNPEMSELGTYACCHLTATTLRQASTHSGTRRLARSHHRTTATRSTPATPVFPSPPGRCRSSGVVSYLHAWSLINLGGEAQPGHSFNADQTCARIPTTFFFDSRSWPK